MTNSNTILSNIEKKVLSFNNNNETLKAEFFLSDVVVGIEVIDTKTKKEDNIFNDGYVAIELLNEERVARLLRVLKTRKLN